MEFLHGKQLGSNLLILTSFEMIENKDSNIACRIRDADPYFLFHHIHLLLQYNYNISQMKFAERAITQKY